MTACGPASLDDLIPVVREAHILREAGRVTKVVGLTVESLGPTVAVGEQCRLEDRAGKLLSLAEVVGFDGDRVFTMPVDPVRGVTRGDRVVATGVHPSLPVGEALLGRILDADGHPLDGLPPPRVAARRPVHGMAPEAMERLPIEKPFWTGIRAMDGLITCGRGQRMGIFAGSGVGKSRLLGAVARHGAADVAVIALVGERGREVRDFIENDLGPAGLSRAVVYVSTSDESPLRRIRAALAATTAAEEFRSRGRHVLLLMDSLTRVAMAQREIGLSTGEPPSAKGYTPSVFALLPRLLERAGTAGGGGSITGIYTVYVEGDDLADPVADAARSLLDGHVVLSRELAALEQYPAIDVLESVSRLMPRVASPDHLGGAVLARRLLATRRGAEDLLAIGAYREGSDPEIDAAVRARASLRSFLVQPLEERATPEDTLAGLNAIRAAAGEGGSS